MSNAGGSLKASIQKERAKITSHSLKLYNEKFLSGELPNPIEIFLEIMINAPRDADRVNAAKELKSLFFLRSPSESEVQIQDAGDPSMMSRQDMDRELKDNLSDITRLLSRIKDEDNEEVKDED